MNNLYYEVRVTELEEKLKKKNDLLSTIRQIKNKLTLKKAFLTLATLTISSAICLCSSLFNPHPNFIMTTLITTCFTSSYYLGTTRRARRFLRSSNEGKIKQEIAKLKERMDSYKELDNKLCNNKEKIKDDKFYNNVIINNYYNDIKKDKVMQRVLKK